MADPIIFPGTVEWSGENPGISLKETPEGPFVALASFFRVVLSPHGRGHALVLLQSPHDASAPAERGNICLHDNEPLARYLVAEFVAHFGAFKGLRRPREPHLPAARQRRGRGRSGQQLQRDRARRRSERCALPGAASASRSASPCPRTSRRRAGTTCRACSSAVGRPRDGERPCASGQARAARDRRAQHHDRHARLLGDLDPRLIQGSSTSARLSRRSSACACRGLAACPGGDPGGWASCLPRPRVVVCLMG